MKEAGFTSDMNSCMSASRVAVPAKEVVLCQEFLMFQSKHSFSEGWEYVFCLFVCLVIQL